MKLNIRALFLIMIMIVGLTLNACGSGENDPVDGDEDGDVDQNSETDQGDIVQPVFKSLRVTINGEFSAEYDVENDVRYVLPVESEVVFAAFVTDDVTAAEDLEVKVLYKDSSEAVENQESVFNNGLWRITLKVLPGQSFVVAATDQAGNEMISEYGLIVPAREEAIIGQWNQRVYNDEQVIKSVNNLKLNDDTSWTETREATQQNLNGVYSFSDEKLLMEGIVPTAKKADEIDPADFRREAEYYVDSTYFSMSNYKRTSSETGNSIIGTWEREYAFSHKNNGNWDQESSTRETLIFGEDGKFTMTVENLLDTSNSIEYSGTYEVHVNESYMDNYGNFLEMQVTSIDGVAVTDQEITYELHVIRANNLLRMPYILVNE